MDAITYIHAGIKVNPSLQKWPQLASPITSLIDQLITSCCLPDDINDCIQV